MNKSFLVLLVIGMLSIAVSSFGFSFNDSWSDEEHSSSRTPATFGSADASASGSSGSVYATTHSTTFKDANGGTSTSSAGASVTSEIVCTEPPTCDDGDADGICDESDNCEFEPNTDQADADDDQVGDACDPCPQDPTDTCNEPPPPCEDIDNDTLCDEFDNCLDTAPGAVIDEFGCEILCDDNDGDGVCNADDECPDDPTDTCNDPPCPDDDNDGVCNEDDACPGIADSSTECLLEIACPCEADWNNHGAYVTCTVQFRNANTIQGVPQLPDLEHIVSEAGCSDCGGSHQGQGCDD